MRRGQKMLQGVRGHLTAEWYLCAPVDGLGFLLATKKKGTVEDRKLEYDCPETPEPREG